MHRVLIYFLFIVLTWGQSKEQHKCPAGQRWLDEENQCAIFGQIITGIQKNGICEWGLVSWGKACVKLGKKPILCPKGQIYIPIVKRCADWLIEEATTEKI
ncbi:uncharacterized protein LOC110177788 [Drosophila serrata]|uniref:uncharacterized protein LOC110177788 n=1 Tax=Drosophila serrata TaxID=7274 RepID=UPI000A1D2F15|nr:uncharacterized protein LOC110177788 [Drosophila serrata]